MSDNTEKPPAAVVSVVQGTTATSSPTERRHANRKCVVTAVTCAVVVAMITAGVLVGIKLFTDADLEKHRIHRQLKTEDALVDEEYYQESDSGNWLLKYHLTEPDRETWALNEFDRGVQILKLQLPSGDFACFVTRQPAVNGTAVATKVNNSATDDGQVIKRASNVSELRYQIAILAGDVSHMLGRSGQEFCADLQVYALYPDTDSPQADTSTVNNGRQRRQAYWYWFCYIRWTLCNLFMFLDSPFNYQYFACLPICERTYYK